MKKRGATIAIIIAAVIIVILFIVFYFTGGSSSFSFSSFSNSDFLGGTRVNDAIREGAQGNIFEGVKLNPFEGEENAEN